MPEAVASPSFVVPLNNATVAPLVTPLTWIDIDVALVMLSVLLDPKSETVGRSSPVGAAGATAIDTICESVLSPVSFGWPVAACTPTRTSIFPTYPAGGVAVTWPVAAFTVTVDDRLSPFAAV